VDLEVADRGLELIVEVNHCYREMQRMKSLLSDQEKKIREKVRMEYESLIRELSTKLLSVMNSNEHNYLTAYQELIGFFILKRFLTSCRKYGEYKK
jgi:hypothetical protein